MTQISRRLGALALLGTALALLGCSGSHGASDKEPLGQLNLPLTTQGASGLKYRLRNATFTVQREYYYYDEAGAGGSNGTTTVSSETDPDARSISLSLEEGYYYVQLSPGWTFEKDGPDGPEAVEATLLSQPTQWVYVQRQASAWAEFDFGIGGKELWLNGKVNIEINVQETPGENGGNAGAAGSWPGGAAGATTGGVAGANPFPSGGIGGAF
jgi:hypothetical protein